MSEEEISKAPAQDITSTDNDEGETGAENSEPRVFDITPDLNIAPAKEENDNPVPIKIPDSILPNIDKIETIKIDTKIQPTIISSEPLKQESLYTKPQIQTPSFGPANPPTKTVGANRTSFNDTLEQNKVFEPSNLQEAVSSIKIEPIKQNFLKTNNQIPNKPWEAKKDSKIKPLRTYETDFAEAMAKKHITTTSAIIAENKKEQAKNETITKDENSQTKISSFVTTQKPIITTKEDILKNAKPPKNSDSHFAKNLIFTLISITLVAGGIYAGYYLYKSSPLSLIYSPKTTPTTQIQPLQNSESLFTVDSKINIAIDSKNENEILNAIRSEIDKDEEEGTIKEIVLTKTKENIIKKVTATEILEIIKIPIPELITRSIKDDWMLGIYTGIGQQKNIFVITTNNFFQNTFAGIIQWEKSMPQDLKQFTYNNNSISQNFTLQGQYKDKIIKNKDVRQYVTENGHINYLYSFISNDKLVITNSEEALTEIINRLEKNAFVR